MKRRSLAAVVCVAATTASSALAQSNPRSAVKPDPVRFWGAMTLGPSIQSGFERAAGDLSLWGSRGKTALSVRGASVSAIFEAGEKHDVSVLIGRRASSGIGTLVGGVGVGVASGHPRAYERFPNEAVLAMGGQALVGFPWVGLGVSAFGTFGQTLRYGGIGVTLAIGKIR